MGYEPDRLPTALPMTLTFIMLTFILYHKRFSRSKGPLIFLIAMVEGAGFEPAKASPADLQSAPFDHSGTPPYGMCDARSVVPLQA